MVARIRCSSRRVAAFESRSPCPAWARQRRSAFVGRGSSSFPLSHLSEYRGAPRGGGGGRRGGTWGRGGEGPPRLSPRAGGGGGGGGVGPPAEEVGGVGARGGRDHEVEAGRAGAEMPAVTKIEAERERVVHA